MSKLLASIKNIFNRSSNNKSEFIFPYAEEIPEKRKQVWENLQKGILLEDSGMLISWGTHYEQLENFKENKKIRADRVEWDLGSRKILDGYTCHIEITQWLWKTNDTITRIDENLGVDEEGMAKFNYLKSYLTDLLGVPSKERVEKFGSFDIGEVCWENGIVNISISGMEKSNCRYSFHIRLAHNL